jgi:CBS domain-containing protein
MQAYFLNLGSKVCDWLNQAGYSYCEGNNMAQNPQWCQPVSVWKRYFGEWIAAGTAEDLLKTKIFFDFRGAYGEQTFVHMLRNHLNEVIAQNPRFFQLLARNVLQLSPPIGFFGNFVVESVGENKKAFDIKSSMMPIVDYARIYALQHNIAATNTFERLQQLYERNLLSQQNYQEMIQAYSYLMQIRLRVQAEAISQGSRKPENYVSPKNLTYIEQKLLKEIFSQTKNFQARLSYDFTGQLGGV